MVRRESRCALGALADAGLDARASGVDRVAALVLAACFALTGCSKARSEARGADAPVVASAAADALGHSEPPESHGGGERGESGPSDLDRPVEELFASTCEHDKKAFECEACRAEVGVVRAPAALFEGGLMTSEKVAVHAVQEPIVLTGEVRFDDRLVAHVSSQADGIIRKVMVSLGSRVKRGQALVEVESLAVGEAEGAYLEAQAMLKLVRQNFERVQTLHERGIASEKDFYEARQELEGAQIRVVTARGKLGRLGGAAPASTAALPRTGGRLVLRAPNDGTVLSMHAVPGEAVRSEESLLTVGENTTVWVWADVYEQDVAKVASGQGKPGLRALVHVRAYPDQDFPGTVDFMSPAMDESSRTVKIRVEAPNPEGRLLAGMFAKVQVFIPGDAEVLAAPRQAVLEDAGRSFVFVRHHDDYFVRRPVRSGRSWLDRVEILEGLQPGQEIAVEGAFLMKSDVLRSKMGAGCAD